MQVTYHTEARHLRHIDKMLNTLPPSNKRQGLLLDGPQITLLRKLDEFVWAVMKEPEPPYYVEARWLKSRKRGTQQDRPYRHWDDLFSCVAIVDAIMAPCLEFAPHLELLRQVFQDHPVCLSVGRGPSARFDARRMNFDVFNDFCATFRKRMLDKHLLRKERFNWGWGSTENLQRLKSYLSSFLGATSFTSAYHFLLLHSNEPLDLQVATEAENSKSLEILSQCRETFFNGFVRKRSLFPVKPGYVWSIEPSLCAGWGLRLTLLWPSDSLLKMGMDLNAHAEGIGCYWVEQATKGAGGYWVQSVDRDLLGAKTSFHTSFFDLQRLQALVQSLEPLAIRNALVRIRNQPKGKFFGLPQMTPRRSGRSPYFKWSRVSGGGESTSMIGAS